MFCCSQVEPSNNTCMIATKGSTSPFFIQAGLVIYNRTSGSTSLNNTSPTSVTITATATTTAAATATTLASNITSFDSTSSSPLPSSTSSSSRKEAAIGAGVGGVLGLALFLALVLLWRQKKQKQGLSEDVQTWENRYRESVTIKTGVIGEAEHQGPHQLDGWNPGGKNSQPYLPHQVQGWSPDEIDGTQIYEVANGARQG